MDDHWRDAAGPDAKSSEVRLLEEQVRAAQAKTQWVLDNLLKPLVDASRELVTHHKMTCLATHHGCPVVNQAQSALDGIACSL